MRLLLALLSAITVALAGLPAFAQDQPAFHPTKTVTIIVPYTPGGGTDAVGRMMAKALEEMWGQTVIVDNRTGGNGSVGSAIVARAAPDGTTMVLSPDSEFFRYFNDQKAGGVTAPPPVPTPVQPAQ